MEGWGHNDQSCVPGRKSTEEPYKGQWKKYRAQNTIYWNRNVKSLGKIIKRKERRKIMKGEECSRVREKWETSRHYNLENLKLKGS